MSGGELLVGLGAICISSRSLPAVLGYRAGFRDSGILHAKVLQWFCKVGNVLEAGANELTARTCTEKESIHVCSQTLVTSH